MLADAFASGGMANVHFGFAMDDPDRRRLVAIKRVTAAIDPSGDLAKVLNHEARIASLVDHINVVSAIELVVGEGEIWFVMELVEGVSLAAVARKLRERGRTIPHDVLFAIIVDALRGLQAIHEAVDEGCAPLGLVHRDISPENILVGTDGVAKIADLGIAKGLGVGPETTTGTVKGKVRYLSPEQVHGAATPRSDVFALAVSAWELLVGRPLFHADSDAEILARVLSARIAAPSTVGCPLPSALEQVLMRALERAPEKRFESAAAMANAIAAIAALADPSRVGAFIADVGEDELRARAAKIAKVSADPVPAPAPTPSTTRRASRAPRSSARRRWLGIAMLGGAALLVMLLGLRVRARDGTGAAVRSTSASAPAAPVAEPPTDNPGGSPAPEDPVPSEKDTSSPVRAHVSKAPPRPEVRASAQRPSARGASCSPPFVYDAKGTKHFKPECF
jgi:serine/threonine-protein kinase